MAFLGLLLKVARLGLAKLDGGVDQLLVAGSLAAARTEVSKRSSGGTRDLHEEGLVVASWACRRDGLEVSRVRDDDGAGAVVHAKAPEDGHGWVNVV